MSNNYNTLKYDNVLEGAVDCINIRQKDTPFVKMIYKIHPECSNNVDGDLILLFNNGINRWKKKYSGILPFILFLVMDIPVIMSVCNIDMIGIGIIIGIVSLIISIVWISIARDNGKFPSDLLIFSNLFKYCQQQVVIVVNDDNLKICYRSKKCIFDRHQYATVGVNNFMKSYDSKDDDDVYFSRIEIRQSATRFCFEVPRTFDVKEFVSALCWYFQSGQHK